MLKKGDYKIEVSARHVHLTESDFYHLFGPFAEFKPLTKLSVNGEFKSNHVVQICGKKGNIMNVAVLGPFRKQSQVEISYSDAYRLGISDVPVRLSGDLHDTPPVKLLGDCDILKLSEGLIVAARHIHINRCDMERYGLTEGQKIDIEAGDERAVTLHNVIVRESDVEMPIVHLDTDEGNSFKY